MQILVSDKNYLEMAGKLVRHDSSHADRVRSGNLPIVVLRDDKYEIHWVKKFSDSRVGLYSSENARSKDKVPWGAVRDVRFETMGNAKGDIQDYLVAENQHGECVAFKILELNVSIWELNEWTALIASMAADMKYSLIGLYLGNLVRSSGFSNFSRSGNSYICT